MGKVLDQEIQSISESQTLLSEQMNELKRVVATIAKSGDYSLNDVTKMWLRLAEDLRRQGEKIKVLARDVKQEIKQKPKPKQDFKSSLTDDEIRALLPLVNKYIFVEKQSLASVKDWLCCRNKEPLQVKSNGMIAYLLNVLQHFDFICRNCQKVATENHTFQSTNGKILNQKDLSKALSVLAKKNGFKKEEREIYSLCKPIFEKVRELSYRKHYYLS